MPSSRSQDISRREASSVNSPVSFAHRPAAADSPAPQWTTMCPAPVSLSALPALPSVNVTPLTALAWFRQPEASRPSPSNGQHATSPPPLGGWVFSKWAWTSLAESTRP